MKKSFFAVMALAAMMFASCAPETFEVTPTSISCYAQENTLVTSVSGTPFTMTSANKYVAVITASGDSIKGNNVGKTTVEVVAENGAKASIAVEVKAKYNTYNEPVTTWGISQSQLKAQLGEPVQTAGDTVLVYFADGAKKVTAFYLFRDNKLAIAQIAPASLTQDALYFLDERYIIYGGDPATSTYLFMDAVEKADAKLLIQFFKSNQGDFRINYQEFPADLRKMPALRPMAL